MELKELIEKWNEQIAMHRRVVEDPLMWTKEDRQKSSHQTQALCAIMDDIKKLSIPRVSQQRELLYFFAKNWNENQTTAETTINSDDIKNCIEKYNCG